MDNQSFTLPERANAAAQALNVTRFTKEVLDRHIKKATALAIEYTQQYTGTFDFMISMKESLSRYNNLTPGQVAAILNVLLAEYRYQERKRAIELIKQSKILTQKQNTHTKVNLSDQSHSTPHQSQQTQQTGQPHQSHPEFEPITVDHEIPNGRYTCVWRKSDSTIDYVTLRVSDANWVTQGSPDPHKNGSRVIAYLSGPDNDSQYTGFAFLTPSSPSINATITLWRKYQTQSQIDNPRLILACRILSTTDPKVLGKHYALKSGNCYICGRTLTTPESIELGIGPICEAKVC